MHSLVAVNCIACTYTYRYSENPNRSDHSLERRESLPQGAAKTDLDNESGIGEESKLEDIDDTPTSIRMVCSYLFCAHFLNLQFQSSIDSWDIVFS